VRHLQSLENALAAWAEESRAPTAATLAYSAGVPARIGEALLSDLEAAGLVRRDQADNVTLAVPLAAFRAGARDLVAKVKAFRFEGERKLNAVADYARSADCRSVVLRRYFGEANPPRCGACDRCRGAGVVAERAAAPPKRPRRRHRRDRGPAKHASSTKSP
jgi:DNA-binding IclR family transcriptional regulator